MKNAQGGIVTAGRVVTDNTLIVCFFFLFNLPYPLNEVSKDSEGETAVGGFGCINTFLMQSDKAAEWAQAASQSLSRASLSHTHTRTHTTSARDVQLCMN